MFKIPIFLPPSDKDPPEGHLRWRYFVVISIYAITITVLWGFDFSPIPGSPVGALDRQVGELKSAVVCANLKSDLERTRSELYAVRREIEMTPPTDLTETVLRRRAELEAAVRDNETRYDKNGCYTVIQ